MNNERERIASEIDWKKAEDHLNFMIDEYKSIGMCGIFGLTLTLYPLKQRYNSGERTQELFDEIMGCE